MEIIERGEGAGAAGVWSFYPAPSPPSSLHPVYSVSQFVHAARAVWAALQQEKVARIDGER